MGAVPKERIPKSKQGKRRSHHHLAPVHLVNCPQCKALKLPHHVCASCGTYKGRQVLPVKGGA
jgi:large subunit ribosomal protein L32